MDILQICILVWTSAYAASSESIFAPWINVAVNPCVTRPNGWQFLYWPEDGECYRIFQKGFPCPETMELTPGKNGSAECKCPPGTALSSRDATCHKLHQQGPCKENEYFGPVIKQNKSSQGHRWGACFPVEECEEGKIFWPKDGKCYDILSKGPCPEGLLVRADGKFGTCSCENDTMASNFWEPGLSCHEHYSQGPCDSGLIFLPNGTCGCSTTMPQYYPQDKKCYPLGSQGPCKEGLVFTVTIHTNGTLEELNGECKCKDGLVFFKEDGKCYQPFTRGPCKHGEMIEVDYTKSENNVACVTVPCPLGHLYFPGGKGCHKVLSQGPCPSGQIVLYQTIENSISDDISYLGVCRCDNIQVDPSSFYKIRSYSGPCLQPRQLENDSSSNKTTEATTLTNICAYSRGFVLWEDGSCYQLYTQGPCSTGGWIVPDRSKGQREGRGWRAGKCECRPGRIVGIGGSNPTCLINPETIGKFLGK